MELKIKTQQICWFWEDLQQIWPPIADPPHHPQRLGMMAVCTPPSTSAMGQIWREPGMAAGISMEMFAGNSRNHQKKHHCQLPYYHDQSQLRLLCMVISCYIHTISPLYPHDVTIVNPIKSLYPFFLRYDFLVNQRRSGSATQPNVHRGTLRSVDLQYGDIVWSRSFPEGQVLEELSEFFRHEWNYNSTSWWSS